MVLNWDIIKPSVEKKCNLSTKDEVCWNMGVIFDKEVEKK